MSNRDPRTESKLRREGYKFVFHDKEPFANINLKASEENPARVTRKIDPVTVTQYALDMIDGALDAFPPIVLLRQPEGGHLVATGMHRIKAVLEAGKDLPEGSQNCFPAYIVTEADPYLCDLLIRILNNLEGKRDTREDQLRHIVSLHEKYPNHSLTELASRFHLKEATVILFWNETQGIRRGVRMGFDFEGAGLAQNTIVALNKIPADQVFKAAAQFVILYKISGRDTEELVKELKEVRNQGESAELAKVEAYQAVQDELRRRNKSRSRRNTGAKCSRFMGQVKSINRLINRGIGLLELTALHDAHTGLEDSITTIEEGIENLQSILVELQRIKRVNASGGSGGSGYAQAASPR